MRTTTRSGSAAAALPSHRHSDALGVVLIALALIVGIALALGNAGAVGQTLGDFFSAMFGRGAWAVPAVLGALGVSILAGRGRVESTRILWGALIVFAAVVGLLARKVAGDYFDPEAVSASGGYLGALIGWAFEAMLGSAKLVGVGALAVIGSILILNEPLRAVAGRAAARTKPKPKPVEAKPRKIVLPEAPKVAVAETRPEETPAVRAAKAKPAAPEQFTLETERGTPKEGYTLPGLSLLAPAQAKPARSIEEMQRNIDTLERTLDEFGIDANVVEVATGPTITRYEIQLGPGIRVNRIVQLADNMAMNLAAANVRVEAPIPGKAAIGVEVPNSQPVTVSLREVTEDPQFVNHPSRLAVALGQDVSGNNKYADLTKMPHLLIGGATNSGKSIGLASIIMSLLLRNTPKDVRMVMIDPKRVELSLFEGVPHLMCPVVKDVKEAPGVLRAVWREMDKRYDMFAEEGVRNIDGWNARASFADKLPYIVVIIDELADLMVQAAAEVETSICRLAQLARATGIHLVIATQRPSVDVITGTIKANISSRIAFAVSSQIDSRTILDSKGAEDLMGRGDMLFLPIDASKPLRVQGCYVSEKEIEEVCDHWKSQERPHYVLNPVQIAVAEREAEMVEQESDPLWEDTVRFVVERGQASTSMIQRRFAIGFQRASRLLDLMEERGIVGPRDGPRPREVLVDIIQLESMLGNTRYESAVPDMDPLD